jgi:hypothetical protein
VTISGKTTRRARCEGTPSLYAVKRTVSDSAHMLVSEDARRTPKCARERLKRSSAVESCSLSEWYGVHESATGTARFPP